jgi:hypothetical protein
MATLSKQPDAVMMAWYRSKKFGPVRPSFAGAPVTSVALSADQAAGRSRES